MGNPTGDFKSVVDAMADSNGRRAFGMEWLDHLLCQGMGMMENSEQHESGCEGRRNWMSRWTSSR